MLGHCSKVYEEKLGDCMSICGNRQIVDDHMFFEGCSHSTACSIILRGANDFMMDEMERSLHDALCIVSKVLESKTLVCCLSTPLLSRVCRSSVAAALSLLCLSISANSLQLSKPTSNWLSRLLLTLCWSSPRFWLWMRPRMPATSLPSCALTTTCIRKALNWAKTKVFFFCEMGIPAILDDNYCYYGLDLLNGKVVNNFKQGVIEPAVNKTKCLKFAVEACITILRIDDMIKVNPAVCSVSSPDLCLARATSRQQHSSNYVKSSFILLLISVDLLFCCERETRGIRVFQNINWLCSLQWTSFWFSSSSPNYS